MKISSTDRQVIRQLAGRYKEICHSPRQTECRRLWRMKNSLKDCPPLIYVRAFAWHEMSESKLLCEDQFLHSLENFFRSSIFRAGFNDDYIFEPWVSVPASYKYWGWGIESRRIMPSEKHGSWKLDYAIKMHSDIKKMRTPQHEIDEKATEESKAVIEDLIGDILPVVVDRAPAWRMWTADISTDLGHLRGIENIMMDMYDSPEWLHELLAFMRDGILKAHEEAEKNGDWSLLDHQNQAMPYSLELPGPKSDGRGVKRKELWTFAAAQELTCVSPEMHYEFMLKYQIPIIEKFGLSAYGCCENLTNKIDILRKIPNLRRIAVAPSADVKKCAEQIKRDYVISYRPSPADMVSYDFNEERITKIVKRDLEYCKGLHVDITLKDVETVQGDPLRIKRWVEVVRKIIDDVWKD